MMEYLGLVPSDGPGLPVINIHAQPVYTRDDSKVSLTLLMRLQRWVSVEFQNLDTTFLNDSNAEQILRISKKTPHPVLVSLPSVQLVCRIDKDMLLNCQLIAFNSIVIKEIVASLEEEYEDLKLILSKINNHQTSICKGIPEEKFVTWAVRKNLSQILIERFLTKVVFRERSCSYVMFESDQADICKSCAALLQSSSLDLHADNDLECPDPECVRTFKYQGSLDKHLQKHADEQQHFSNKVKEEDVMCHKDTGNIKMEPEITLKEAKTEKQYTSDDGQFIDRLLDDIDEQTEYPKHRKKRRKSKKPSRKDFFCSDCGKSFYYQKNLFTHVVEAHGKSLHELPDLSVVKAEDGTKRKRRKKGKGENSDAHCNECDITFKFASGLYNHRKRMHGDTEKVQCQHCNKMVKMCTLDQHVKEEHSTPRYACQFCGKGFYYKSFMLNHQRLHTGDYKECVCDLCGAVYKSVQVLNRHVRNAHQDLRNFKCPHCDKAFHNKQRLDRHVNSQHTKSKLWPCPACHSKYDRKDNLRTHIRKNHSGVLNSDTIVLTPIENDGSIEQTNNKKCRTLSPNNVINPTFLFTVERNTTSPTRLTFPPDRKLSLEDTSSAEGKPIMEIKSNFYEPNIRKREEGFSVVQPSRKTQQDVFGIMSPTATSTSVPRIHRDCGNRVFGVLETQDVVPTVSVVGGHNDVVTTDVLGQSLQSLLQNPYSNHTSLHGHPQL